ncbi:MAG: prephenate dehydrogenase [Sciscionella sp.]
MRDVCVIGLGLIGGSVLRAARAHGRTAWGTAESPGDRAAAHAEGFTVSESLPAALESADCRDALVVLAVPLTAVDEVLMLLGKHAPLARLTDVVSVKVPVAFAVRSWAPRARYVGGHPMAGTAESGWHAGDATLFTGTKWAVCGDTGTTRSDEQRAVDREVFRDVLGLALACGAHVVPTTAAEHDDAIARISHLPHLLAAVLAAVGAAGGPLSMSLAAGSFTDGTRVSSTRPELVRAMCEGNASALLPALDDALGKLGAARGALASTRSLKSTIDSGFTAAGEFRQSTEAAHTEVTIDLRAPEAMSALLGVGAAGGVLTELRCDTVLARVPVPPGRVRQNLPRRSLPE